MPANRSKENEGILNRFEKDVKGSLTTILILGIILKTKRVWSFQIKQQLSRLYGTPEPIKNSSLYTLLGKLENRYHLISSEWDEEVQRRFFKPTEKTESEFERVKNYWKAIMNLSEKSFEKLELLDATK